MQNEPKRDNPADHVTSMHASRRVRGGVRLNRTRRRGAFKADAGEPAPPLAATRHCSVRMSASVATATAKQNHLRSHQMQLGAFLLVCARPVAELNQTFRFLAGCFFY